MYGTYFKIASILVSVLNADVAKTDTSFLTLETQDTCVFSDLSCHNSDKWSDWDPVVGSNFGLASFFPKPIVISNPVARVLDLSSFLFSFYYLFFFFFQVFLEFSTLLDWELGCKARVFGWVFLICLSRDFLALNSLMYSSRLPRRKRWSILRLPSYVFAFDSALKTFLTISTQRTSSRFSLSIHSLLNQRSKTFIKVTIKKVV